jgi:hypothetical protein
MPPPVFISGPTELHPPYVHVSRSAFTCAEAFCSALGLFFERVGLDKAWLRFPPDMQEAEAYAQELQRTLRVSLGYELSFRIGQEAISLDSQKGWDKLSPDSPELPRMDPPAPVRPTSPEKGEPSRGEDPSPSPVTREREGALWGAAAEVEDITLAEDAIEYVCPICKAFWLTAPELDQHMETMHPPEGAPPPSPAPSIGRSPGGLLSPPVWEPGGTPSPLLHERFASGRRESLGVSPEGGWGERRAGARGGAGYLFSEVLGVMTDEAMIRAFLDEVGAPPLQLDLGESPEPAASSEWPAPPRHPSHAAVEEEAAGEARRAAVGASSAVISRASALEAGARTLWPDESVDEDQPLIIRSRVGAPRRKAHEGKKELE